MGFKNDDASSIVVNDAGCESTKDVCERVAPAEPTCDEAAPSALKCFGTDCFALVTDTKSSFDTAACQCKRLGGSLACFTSQAQEDEVVNLWTSTADVDNWDAKMWFGLNDQETENSWTCGGGTMPFTNWRAGEPKVEEPVEEAAPAFEGKSVTCTLTIDNTL